MALTLQCVPLPSGKTVARTLYKTDVKESSPSAIPEHLFVLRENLRRLQGLFEGLSYLGLEGKISVVIHEGLYEVTGTVTIFQQHHHALIQHVLIQANILGAGIAATYSKWEARYAFEYTLEWR